MIVEKKETTMEINVNGQFIVHVKSFGTSKQKHPNGNPAPDLLGANPNCEHNIVTAPGGGVKCTKCKGWFCY
jgi:hypothetical protein